MKRLEINGRLHGEFTFGMTGTPFTAAGYDFEFMAHEVNLHAVGYAGNVESFRVRLADNQVVTLSRPQMAEYLAAAYVAVAPRIEEYAAGRRDLTAMADTDLDGFDPGKFFARRSPALIAIEEDEAIRKAEHDALDKAKRKPVVKEKEVDDAV